MAPDTFRQIKDHILHRLNGESGYGADKSPKGSLDEPIKDIVELINSQSDYVTTSSCSGRIAVFVTGANAAGAAERKKDSADDTRSKGFGGWVLSKHGHVTLQEVTGALNSIEPCGDGVNAVLKHETVIFHVQARGLQEADKLLKAALGAGFRESGMVMSSNGTVSVGIRTTSRALQIPLIHDGVHLLSETALEGMVSVANKKFDENCTHTDKLRSALHTLFNTTVSSHASDANSVKCSDKPLVLQEKTLPVRTELALTRIQVPESSQLKRYGHACMSITNYPGTKLSSATSNHESASKLDKTSTNTLRQSIIVCGGFGFPIIENNTLQEGKESTYVSCRQSRLMDIIIADMDCNGCLSPWRCIHATQHNTEKVSSPCAREMHTAVHIPSSVTGCAGFILLHGGRASPVKAIDEMWVYSLDLGVWRDVTDLNKQRPPARWGHTATSTKQGIIYAGGRNENTVFKDTYILTYTYSDSGEDSCAWPEFVWKRLPDLPQPLFFHMSRCINDYNKHIHNKHMNNSCMSDAGEVVCVLGGLTHLGDCVGSREVYIYSFTGDEWQLVSCVPQGVFAGAVAIIYDRPTSVMSKEEDSLTAILLISGGSSEGSKTQAAEIRFGRWRWLDVLEGSHENSTLAMHNTLIPISDGTSVIAIGGGVTLGPFGSAYAKSSIIRILNTQNSNITSNNGKNKSDKVKKNQLEEKQRIHDNANHDDATSNIGSSNINMQEGGSECLLVAPRYVKELKTILATHGYIDTAYLITPAHNYVSLSTNTSIGHSKVKGDITNDVPITEDSSTTHMNNSDVDCSGMMGIPIQHGCMDKVMQVAAVMELVENGAAGRAKMECTPKKRGTREPSRCSLLSSQLKNLLIERGSRDEVAVQLAAVAADISWEVLGADTLLAPADTFASSDWDHVRDDAFQIAAKLYRCSRVVLKAEISKGPRRDSRAKIAWPHHSDGNDDSEETGPGTPGWVTVLENGISQSFDVTRVMFCTGNIPEKLRVASFNCRGETVLDCYAGIGYYTLPYLIKAGASTVHACEWNPHSIRALKYNLEQAGPQFVERCIIHEGDNRSPALAATVKGMCHRVNLGLLPSSQPAWPLAAAALHATQGGWLHVHGNASTAEKDEWGTQIGVTFTSLLVDLHGEKWTAVCRGVHKVKSYAPRVAHYVADIECRPPKP